MGSMTMYKPTTLHDIIPYLRNIRQRGGETVAACPICEAGVSNGHHLYVTESEGWVRRILRSGFTIITPGVLKRPVIICENGIKLCSIILYFG